MRLIKKGFLSILRIQPPISAKKVNKAGCRFRLFFSKQGDLLVTEIFGSASYEVSPLGAGAMSSYKIERNGKLKVITQSLPNGGTASCWNVRVGKFVYVANNSSSSISLYQVNKDGSLENYQ